MEALPSLPLPPFQLSIFLGGWGGASSGKKGLFPTLQSLKAPLTLLQVSKQLSDQTHAPTS